MKLETFWNEELKLASSVVRSVAAQPECFQGYWFQVLPLPWQPVDCCALGLCLTQC